MRVNTQTLNLALLLVSLNSFQQWILVRLYYSLRFLYTTQRHNSPTLQKTELHQGRIKNSLMKQDPNELRVAAEEKSIKVYGFSTREQLCVFVVGGCLPLLLGVDFFLFFIFVCVCVYFVTLLSFFSTQKFSSPCSNVCLHLTDLCVYTGVCTLVKHFLEACTAFARQPSASNPSGPGQRGLEDGRRNSLTDFNSFGIFLLFLEKRPLAVLECKHVPVTNPYYLHANSALVHAHKLGHAIGACF